jgi:hypothetical protein
VERRRAWALCALGAWTIAVPYLGLALGIHVDVARRVEIVDHVIPGVVLTGIGVFLAARADIDAAKESPAIFAGCVAFLAGFWVLATHISLIGDAVSGKVSWGAALWHAISAPLIVLLALWIIQRPRIEPSARP